jgi:hypothetical protein
VNLSSRPFFQGRGRVGPRDWSIMHRTEAWLDEWARKVAEMYRTPSKTGILRALAALRLERLG